MSRQPSPILAYHEATRRAYLFPGQTEAAHWLRTSGRHRGALNTARSNLIAASTWPGRTRSYKGFVWVRGEPDAPVALLMDKLIRRLRVWALIDADWKGMPDSTLVRTMTAAGIVDPAHEPTPSAPLASGVRLMDGMPD